jgi:hypothetical protein
VNLRARTTKQEHTRKLIENILHPCVPTIWQGTICTILGAVLTQTCKNLRSIAFFQQQIGTMSILNKIQAWFEQWWLTPNDKHRFKDSCPLTAATMAPAFLLLFTSTYSREQQPMMVMLITSARSKGFNTKRK